MKKFALIQIRRHYSDSAPVWRNKMVTIQLKGENSEVRNTEVEVGEVMIGPEHSDNPAILAVHPSGSNYRQFSSLVPLLPDGYCSKLVGLNLFGYGKSTPWDSSFRSQTMPDLVSLIDGAVKHSEAVTKWHLIGHSMGGGAALAAAAYLPHMELQSLCVYEPNLLNLLYIGTSDERRHLDTTSKFFEEMLQFSEDKNWDRWGQTFYHFWFPGNWDSVEESTRMKLIQSTLPHTIDEIRSLQWAIEQGPGYAELILKQLADLPANKRIVLSKYPGTGSDGPSKALATLLSREAGFEIITSSDGGHMGPLTHPETCLPLLLV